MLEEKKRAEQRKQAEAVRKFHEEVVDGDKRMDDEAKVVENADESGKDTKGTTKVTDEAKSTEGAKSSEPSSVLPRLPALPETSVSPNTVEEDGTSSRATNRSVSASDIALVDINVHDAKDSVTKRLVSNSNSSSKSQKPEQPMMTSPLRPPPALSPVREAEAEDDPLQLAQPSPQLKKSQKKSNAKPKTKPPEPGVFDQFRYNPDGSLRTVHTLPDFQSSLREAMKARYLRMKGAQWIERELSTSEIFAKKSSKRTKASTSSKSSK